MTSLLAGTVAHGARGGRGVSTSHHRRTSPELPGILWNSPVTALTTLVLIKVNVLNCKTVKNTWFTNMYRFLWQRI